MLGNPPRSKGIFIELGLIIMSQSCSSSSLATSFPNYTSEDPSPGLADEEHQEIDEDIARMF